LHRTTEVNQRLTLAMHANGIFSAEQLAEESKVKLELIEALLDGDASKLDVVSSLKLRTVLKSYSLRWLLFGEGDPSEHAYRLTSREAWLLESYRQMLEAGRDRVDRAVKRYTPK
jgi:hypothetical protein